MNALQVGRGQYAFLTASFSSFASLHAENGV
jgi:hypothetical protein